MHAMRLNDFDIYKDLLREKCGMHLSQDKTYLLDSRLTLVSKKWNFSSLDAMTMALHGVPEPGLVKDVVEAMTDPETSFFRDGVPFDAFRTIVIPSLLKSRKKARKFRIWSAGCSNGQEPYSLAMILKEEEAKLSGWKADMMATDISASALATAERAEYPKFEVQRGLPVHMLVKYFEQHGDHWHLSPDIKSMVKFRYFNLLDNSVQLGGVDVIFCRNVVCDFTRTLRADTIKKFAQIIPQGGFLFLGATEDISDISDAFIPLDGVPGAYSRA
jgi:chemotaxis protein methyltransferase CheR